MRTKLVKSFLSLGLKALLMFVLSIILLQISISQTVNITKILSVIREHHLIAFAIKASVVSIFFFMYPYLLKHSKNEYTFKQYNRLLWFRWVVVISFLVFEFLNVWG